MTAKLQAACGAASVNDMFMRRVEMLEEQMRRVERAHVEKVAELQQRIAQVRAQHRRVPKAVLAMKVDDVHAIFDAATPNLMRGELP